MIVNERHNSKEEKLCQKKDNKTKNRRDWWRCKIYTTTRNKLCIFVRMCSGDEKSKNQ